MLHEENTSRYTVGKKYYVYSSGSPYFLAFFVKEDKETLTFRLSVDNTIAVVYKNTLCRVQEVVEPTIKR